MEANKITSATADAPSTIAPTHDNGGNAAGSDNLKAELVANRPGEFGVIRRNGKVTAFDPNKIMVAMTKAFLEVEGGTAAASSRIHETVARLTEQAVNAITRRIRYGVFAMT